MAEKDNQVGQVTGLAWTEVGGELLTIEAVALMPGKGKTMTTGKLGDVMQESIQAALSVVRSAPSRIARHRRDFYQKNDIHIHLPEGATPKDGPSPASPSATALVSVLTGIPVRCDVAMTGEITLRGEVLPIGGLKEKAAGGGARRHQEGADPGREREGSGRDSRQHQEPLEIQPVKWIDRCWMVVSNEQLVQFIASVPSLQENGRFSKERYEAVVASQNMSKEMFEARLRQDMAMQQLILPVTEGGIAGREASARWLAAQMEQREVSEAPLLPEKYLGQAKLAADAVQKYYEANRKQFELPEQVRAEFVVLSRDELAAAVAINEEEARKYYTSHADRYKTGETRRASHILIRVDSGAPEAAVAAARAKADQLLAQVRKAPADFAKLAKDNSQDPGSAAKGGDLDWFGRGAMVKAFEDAAFALKDGQVSDVVRSDFGFHVIRVTGVRPEHVKPFEEVKAEILAELKREAGMKKYADAAEAFGNTVYEQADSLKPAAEKWKLDLRQSPWLAKGGKLARRRRRT
jgi:parvulin-like peptidyl-prolyl isomerase